MRMFFAVFVLIALASSVFATDRRSRRHAAEAEAAWAWGVASTQQPCPCGELCPCPAGSCANGFCNPNNVSMPLPQGSHVEEIVSVDGRKSYTVQDGYHLQGDNPLVPVPDGYERRCDRGVCSLVPTSGNGPPINVGSCPTGTCNVGSNWAAKATPYSGGQAYHIGATPAASSVNIAPQAIETVSSSSCANGSCSSGSCGGSGRRGRR